MRQNIKLLGILGALVFVVVSFVGCDSSADLTQKNMNQNLMEDGATNVIAEDRMTLVLSAPSIHSKYYASAFEKIIDFHVRYANAIISSESDNVVIIVDADTRGHFEGKVPDDILFTAEMYDIWMRDFTTVDPVNPVQFVYTDASMSVDEAAELQENFSDLADGLSIERKQTDLVIDGGNIVDNYAGRVVTTERFLEDNDLEYEAGKEKLKEVLGATEVAILPPDEDALAHSDGMVSWIADDVLLVNNYGPTDFAFREAVLAELEDSFPGVKVIEVPVEYGENEEGKEENQWEGFSSACGVNLNATVTRNSIYVPTFDMAHDDKVLEIIRANTDKKIIPIDAQAVCPMGGSVRCLTWQVTGDNATKVIEAARLP